MFTLPPLYACSKLKQFSDPAATLPKFYKASTEILNCLNLSYQVLNLDFDILEFDPSANLKQN